MLFCVYIIMYKFTNILIQTSKKLEAEGSTELETHNCIPRAIVISYRSSICQQTSEFDKNCPLTKSILDHRSVQ